MWNAMHEFITKHWVLSLWAWLIVFLLLVNHTIHLFNKRDK